MNGVEGIQQAAHRYDFVAALRRLDCVFADRPRLGRSVRPGDDAVRLAQMPHLGFAAGALAEWSAGRTAGGTLRVFVLGLLGPNGPLPLHLCEYVLDRVRREGDTTLRAFLDLFHHRLLSLFWRAMADSQPAVEVDRPREDRFARHLGSCIGFAAPPEADEQPQLSRARRHWGGHFARQVRTAAGLQALLAGFFRVPVRVEEFVGRWLRMPGDIRTRLGREGTAELGSSAMLGEEFWDCRQSIRIVCGPLSIDQYERLLPGTPSWRRFGALVHSYLGLELGWDLRLHLADEHVPPLRLGADARLGWTSWLGQVDPQRPAADLLLQSDVPYRPMSAPRERHVP
ncbi:MAG: type VI secretion system baseplate subunit TssG [Planctomycetes bacterium]|nr:type VI secretion system baseplate subunit TssG [Planctomycetota bacterium]